VRENQKFAPCLGSKVAIRDGRHGSWSSAAGPGANAWTMHLPGLHGRSVTLVALCNTTMGHPFYLVKDLLRTLAEF
jgi:hypothetical protein